MEKLFLNAIMIRRRFIPKGVDYQRCLLLRSDYYDCVFSPPYGGENTRLKFHATNKTAFSHLYSEKNVDKSTESGIIEEKEGGTPKKVHSVGKAVYY